MNKIYFLSLFFILLTLTSFVPKNEASFFVGTWEGKDGKGTSKFIFKKNGTVYFEVDGKKFGGKKFKIENKKHSLKYLVIKNDKYYYIDVALVDVKDPKNIKELFFLCSIIDDNKIRMASNYDGVRPTSFTNDNSIYINRVGK